MLKMLPEAIKEPLAIIQSQTCPDRAVVILQMEHNNKKIIKAVEVDGRGLQNSTIINSNALTTLFAKGNAISQLKTAIENTINGKNELFYWNKKEALTLLQTKGLQLPSSLPGEDFVNSIRNNSSNVKTKFNDVTEKFAVKSLIRSLFSSRCFFTVLFSLFALRRIILRYSDIWLIAEGYLLRECKKAIPLYKNITPSKARYITSFAL